jgi:hypothetical protein
VAHLDHPVVWRPCKGLARFLQHGPPAVAGDRTHDSCRAMVVWTCQILPLDSREGRRLSEKSAAGANSLAVEIVTRALPSTISC